MLEKRRWTKEEEEYLLSSFERGRSSYEIGKDLNRTQKAVQLRHSKLNIDAAGKIEKRLWTDKEDEYLITSIISGKSLNEICRNMKRSKKSVQGRCARLKIKVVKEKKKAAEGTLYIENVKCPFFAEFYCNMIVKCEGISDKSSILLKFEDERSLKNHVKGYCNSEYLKCPIYKTLEEKYR
ncbi:MAG: hypothetical protein IKY78_07070 [Clostridia bacterium]|nr:hypothetical protein [Clostridia bacterium]